MPERGTAIPSLKRGHVVHGGDTLSHRGRGGNDNEYHSNDFAQLALHKRVGN